MSEYVQNLMSLEVHRVEIRDGKRLSLEQCQLDDAKHLAEITQEEAEAAERKCGHCYPVVEVFEVPLPRMPGDDPTRVIGPDLEPGE